MVGRRESVRMSVGEWIETGRLQVAVMWTLGTAMLVASLLDVSVAGFEPEQLSVLATVLFATSSAYLDSSDEGTAMCVRRWLRRLRGSDTTTTE